MKLKFTYKKQNKQVGEYETSLPISETEKSFTAYVTTNDAHKGGIRTFIKERVRVKTFTV